MHCSALQDRYVSVRATKGGGTRLINLPTHSTMDDIITEGEMLFFPDGVSSQGSTKAVFVDVVGSVAWICIIL